jgi:predicted transcriptional regulator of viral defense system
MRTTDFPVKLLVFFARNPEETLTIEDVQNKWDITYQAAQAATYRLANAGWLKRSELINERGKIVVYEIGPLMRQELDE